MTSASSSSSPVRLFSDYFQGQGEPRGAISTCSAILVASRIGQTTTILSSPLGREASLTLLLDYVRGARAQQENIVVVSLTPLNALEAKKRYEKREGCSLH